MEILHHIQGTSFLILLHLMVAQIQKQQNKYIILLSLLASCMYKLAVTFSSFLQMTMSIYPWASLKQHDQSTMACQFDVKMTIKQIENYQNTVLLNEHSEEFITRIKNTHTTRHLCLLSDVQIPNNQLTIIKAFPLIYHNVFNRVSQKKIVHL